MLVLLCDYLVVFFLCCRFGLFGCGVYDCGFTCELTCWVCHFKFVLFALVVAASVGIGFVGLVGSFSCLLS